MRLANVSHLILGLLDFQAEIGILVRDSMLHLISILWYLELCEFFALLEGLD
jgi:hypothetical protein